MIMKNFLLLTMMLVLLQAGISTLKAQKHEFADFGVYAEQNRALGAPKKGEKRVVFMGNSITWNWVRFRGDWLSRTALSVAASADRPVINFFCVSAMM